MSGAGIFVVGICVVLHDPPPYLEKRKCVSTSLMQSAAPGPVHLACTKTHDTFINNSWTTNGPNSAVAYANRRKCCSERLVHAVGRDLEKTGLTCKVGEKWSIVG